MDITSERGGWLKGKVTSKNCLRLLRELNSELVEQSPGRWFVRRIDSCEPLGGPGFIDPKDAVGLALAFSEPQDTDDDEGDYLEDSE